LRALRVLRQPRRAGLRLDLEGVANSFLPGIGGAIVNAAEGVAKHVNETSTGTADGIKDAISAAGRTVDRIARSQTQHNHGESTTTTDTTETMQSLTRTFSNPYRDRSLQLGFIPVFRHFEVQTRPAAVKPGMSLHLGATRTAEQAGVRVSDVLADATTRVDASTLQQSLASMLAGSREASVATRSTQKPSAVGALLWSQSAVREDSVLVPLAAPETAASAFGLKGESRASFFETLGRITHDFVAKLVPFTTQEVHLFIGTHIEPVAGECILKDVPPLPALPD
jgi:hypothetical protein